MPLFSYKAVREDGSSVLDEMTAASASEARLLLEARGLLILSLQKKNAAIGGSGANQKDFLLFNQEFATLVKAGLPILQSLEILHKRTARPGFKSALTGVIDAIRGGSALSDAMAANPAFFPPLFTATVRAGEQSGALVDVLKRYIAYQKRMLAVRAKVRNALFYPVFLVIATVAVVALFVLYIIPNFTQMYSDLGALPFLTRMMIAVTNRLSQAAPLLAAALVAGGIGFSLWRRTGRGRTALDALVLKVPLVRSLTSQYVLAQLTRTLATVLRGGIPLVQALDTTAGVIGNLTIADRLRQSRQLLTEGVGLAVAFERTKLAPDITVRMIEVGESSGDLPQMLEDVADFYEQEVEGRLTMITTMIEPVLMLTMGTVIAVIVVALYLPIFEMGAQLK